MTLKQERDGRYWAVELLGPCGDDAEVIFSKDKCRVVIKVLGVTVIVENMSIKELNQ